MASPQHSPVTVTASMHLAGHVESQLNLKALARESPTCHTADEAREPPKGVQEFKIAVFSSQQYVLDFLQQPLQEAFPAANIKFFESRLKAETAPLAAGCDAVCCFVNDRISEQVILELKSASVKWIAMRCAGFDKVDVTAAHKHGLRVVRVPAYSPRSVAEHALALTFTLARNLHLCHQRVMAGNYTLNGLVGVELSSKCVGVLGTGKIGASFVRLLTGFDCRVLAYDPFPSPEVEKLGAKYVGLEELLSQADIVSLHTPLMPSTFRIINKERLALMKPSALLINVSRGGLVDTQELITALQEGRLAGAAMDVYEKEGGLFFRDMTRYAAKERLQKWDKQFQELLALPNFVITPHSAFLTAEALASIAATTVENLRACALGLPLVNEVKP